MPDRLFDADSGLLKARAFASPRIHREEQERLFSRSWLLVGPVAWLAEPGSIVTNTLGQLPVMAWRARSGRLHVFLNRCVGGEAPLFVAERGAVDALRCLCHGWLFTPEPGPAAVQPAAVSKVDIFFGFVFASLDPDAPPLAEWIGEFGWYWQVIENQFAGGVTVCGEASLRTQLPFNWKIAAEAHCGDTYSDLTLTRATREVLDLGPALAGRQGMQVAVGRGAMAVALDREADGTDDLRRQMTPIFATLFPNISYDGRGHALHVWHPRGVSATEVQTYCLAGQSDGLERRTALRRRCQMLFGPAGLLTHDYEAAWTSISKSVSKTSDRDLNVAMGLGRERRTNLPGRSADLASEMNQRAFYAWWQAMLRAPSRRLAADRISIFKPAAATAAMGDTY